MVTITGNYEEITVKGESVTLSLLVWRRFRRKPEGYVERVLDLNPGLADLGAHIPIGTVIKFPIDREETKPVEKKTIRLWD